MNASLLFDHDVYTIRRKVLRLFGGAFHVYAADGQLLLYCTMKAFKLKEDLRIYTDESKSTEILRIAARKILDFSSAYDVYDSALNEKVGLLRRKGFKSMLRDEWEILDAREKPIGLIQEDSTALALLRRFVEFASTLLPQKYHVTVGTQIVATMKQNFNPFVFRLTVDLTPDTQSALDPRLAVAAGMLLAAVEGRQG
ncbi:MAG: hypothetical protein WD042_12600 [Phycisphaeraceae bacterium]